jgi:hypothetical protein
MTLAEKLHAIQRLARKVPKNGVNQEQGWTYMRIEDVVDVATRAMRRHKLLLTVSMEHRDGIFSMTRTSNERGGGSLMDLVVKWVLEDVESGETRAYHIPGSGWDYNSKATSKALTDSRKYAMILIFNLKAGDDPEERGPVARDAAKDRQQEIADAKLANAAAGKGIDADTPALYYQFYEESKTALITGDKELMKRNADLLKEFKLGAKVIVSEAQLDVLRMRLEERGLPFKKLQAT